MEKLRPLARQIVDDLLHQVQPKGQMEFIQECAFHLPVIVISEYLGIPVKDREQVKEWSDETSRICFIRADEPDRRERSQRGLEKLLAYFKPLIHERRKYPRDDLVLALVQAKERGDLLSQEEVLATCTVPLFADHETYHQPPGQWLDGLYAPPRRVGPATQESCSHADSTCGVVKPGPPPVPRDVLVRQYSPQFPHSASHFSSTSAIQRP